MQVLHYLARTKKTYQGCYSSNAIQSINSNAREREKKDNDTPMYMSRSYVKIKEEKNEILFTFRSSIVRF